MTLSFPQSPLRIAVLISGGGTTLENLIRCRDEGSLDVDIARVISSNPDARGLEIAVRHNIRKACVDWEKDGSPAECSQRLFDLCREVEPHLIVMGGFLKRVEIPDDFHLRVMNIHPSLIPAFCGAGFSGLKVHRAALDYGVKLSGCTVHFVDEQYDHGPIILQRVVPVEDDDTPESLAKRVFAAECEVYPEALRLYAAGRLKVEGRKVRILDG